MKHSTGEATDQEMSVLDCYPIHLTLLGKDGVNWLHHVAVEMLHIGHLHDAGWGQGPKTLVTPVKTFNFKNNYFSQL